MTPALIVVMGVAGCGKSTIGQLLAERLGLDYAEADAFHPAANVAKMAAGHPLDDDDRWPWLTAIGEHLRSRADSGVVVSCSALKRRYRDQLRVAAPRAWFLHLVLDEATAARRVAARPGHFMPASLVRSQFAALEPLAGEAGIAVDATGTTEQIVTAALAAAGGEAARKKTGTAAPTATDGKPAQEENPAATPAAAGGKTARTEIAAGGTAAREEDERLCDHEELSPA